jgi:hypothetical protein
VTIPGGGEVVSSRSTPLTATPERFTEPDLFDLRQILWQGSRPGTAAAVPGRVGSAAGIDFAG